MKSKIQEFRLLFLIFIWNSIFPCVLMKFSPENFDRNVKTLQKVIHYIGRRPHQMNADVTLGVAIAEANIASTLLHENCQYIGKKNINALKNVLSSCDNVRRSLKIFINPENEDTKLLQNELSNPEIWIERILWKNISYHHITPSRNIKNREIIDLTMQGMPKESESDQCLVAIVQETLINTCKIPNNCIAMLIKRDHARGYPLAHRLLILKTAKAMGCKMNMPLDFTHLIQIFCTNILKDLVDIEAAGFPYNTRDLMMEQVVLCGMEGYLEFLNEQYENLILNWSHFGGCYSSFGSSSENKIGLVRRTSRPTDFGCDSHATGLAVAALSLYIRENVENAFI